MRVPIDSGVYAGNTECAAQVGFARPDADLRALFREMLPPEEAAKIYWPLEAAAGEWIEAPVYRHYNEPGGNGLSPEIFAEPSDCLTPAYIAIGLYGVAKGTPTRDAMRANSGLR